MDERAILRMSWYLNVAKILTEAIPALHAFKITSSSETSRLFVDRAHKLAAELSWLMPLDDGVFAWSQGRHLYSMQTVNTRNVVLRRERALVLQTKDHDGATISEYLLTSTACIYAPEPFELLVRDLPELLDGIWKMTDGRVRVSDEPYVDAFPPM